MIKGLQGFFESCLRSPLPEIAETFLVYTKKSGLAPPWFPLNTSFLGAGGGWPALSPAPCSGSSSEAGLRTLWRGVASTSWHSELSTNIGRKSIRVGGVAEVGAENKTGRERKGKEEEERGSGQGAGGKRSGRKPKQAGRGTGRKREKWIQDGVPRVSAGETTKNKKFFRFN